MSSRRLVLVIGSQCPALGTLSFLPAVAGPVELAGLPQRQRLLVELRDLLVDGPGECAPVAVADQSGPGLLLNPTKASADAALVAALAQAHEQQAVLLVHFLGHGIGVQTDPGAPARHLLHVWDTVADPVDTEPESNGWDPYELIVRRRPHVSDAVGLVLLVDACQAAWAKQQVDAWGGVRGGLLSAWLGSSGDQRAWDACFTRTLVGLLERGVSAGEHPRRALVPELLPADLEPLVSRACPRQAPRLGGYKSDNAVLVLARNRRASALATELGVDGATETLLLRLTNDYVSFAIEPIVEAARACRVLVVTGGPGVGNTTLRIRHTYRVIRGRGWLSLPRGHWSVSIRRRRARHAFVDHPGLVAGSCVGSAPGARDHRKILFCRMADVRAIFHRPRRRRSSRPSPVGSDHWRRARQCGARDQMRVISPVLLTCRWS